MKRCLNCGHNTAEHHHDRDVRRGESGTYAREYRCLTCGAGGNEVVYRGEILNRNGPARDGQWNDRRPALNTIAELSETSSSEVETI